MIGRQAFFPLTPPLPEMLNRLQISGLNALLFIPSGTEIFNRSILRVAPQVVLVLVLVVIVVAARPSEARSAGFTLRHFLNAIYYV